MDGSLPVEFVGQRRALFWLAFRTGILTVLTLGIYRFWMKSRLRRWYWSAVRPGGLPLEYVGEPMEKLLGFLIAVVILAFYIGIVNLLLMFVSFSLLANNFAAYAVSLLGVIPLWFYARYRARRYVLARTRWRGIRFGLEPGAWSYAFRAMGHWFVTIATLGALWPRMTFGLEKFRTDRTFFGSVRLHQGGNWRMLMPHFVHALIGGALSAGAIIAGLGEFPNALYLLAVSVPWFLYGVFHYQAEATGLLARNKSAGGLALNSAPSPSKIFRINVFGTTAMVILFAAPVIILGIAVLAMQSEMDQSIASPVGLPPAAAIAAAVVGTALYFLVFVLWATLRHVVLTMPIWQHYAETLSIEGSDALGGIGQRERDGFQEAEGFAEALDVGASL